MKLYSYFRSSAAYRARIALHLKGLAFDYVPVHLRKGEQDAQAYRVLNRQAPETVLFRWIERSGDRAVAGQCRRWVVTIGYRTSRWPATATIPL